MKPWQASRMSKKKHEEPGADAPAELPASPPPADEISDEALLPAVSQLLSEDPLVAKYAGDGVTDDAPAIEAAIEEVPPEPVFAPTHEVVSKGGIVVPVVQEAEGFRAEDGELVTRADIADSGQSVRRSVSGSTEVRVEKVTTGIDGQCDLVLGGRLRLRGFVQGGKFFYAAGECSKADAEHVGSIVAV